MSDATMSTSDFTIPDGVNFEFEQTLPRSVIHRRSIGEILLTDSARIGPHHFAMGTQLPRTHQVWSDRTSSFHDTLAAAEAARQGCVYVAHHYYGVPTGMSFISQEIHYDIVDVDAFADDGTPPEWILQGYVSDTSERNGTLAAMSFRGEVGTEGRLIGVMSGDMMFLPDRDYDGLRDHLRSKQVDFAPPSTAPTIAAAQVGRRDQRNVVISEPTASGDGVHRFEVVVDRSHPSYFDHAYDHLPGPFILESYRQTAIAAASLAGAAAPQSLVVSAIHASFQAFGELDALAETTAVVGTVADGKVPVRLGLHQQGREIASADLELAVRG